MNAFMNQDFLLETETAKKLYHQVAATLPIVDYHCHISPEELAENRRFQNLTEAWLGGDHYKWRLMRANGVDEDLITGNAPPYEKFLAFATLLPRAVGNPVYHWAHLELQRYFDCHTPLTAETAPEIWAHCNNLLQTDDRLTTRGIVSRSKVTTIVTTDDPVDSLQWHKQLAEDPSFTTAVLPAWRPDKAINIHQEGFSGYLSTLSTTSGVSITNFDSLTAALSKRMDHFAAHGCLASDHGLGGVTYQPATPAELNQLVVDRLAGQSLTPSQQNQYQFGLLLFLGEQYAHRGWAFEIHLGAERNVNQLAFQRLGADTGYDAVSPTPSISGLSTLLDQLHTKGSLPKTLLFSLNPNDDAILNTLAGGFQKTGARSWVQQGSAWWFNDTKSGMEKQMTSFATLGLLGNFLGMLTDSRSFMSYTRHEYFRRILCNLLGGWVEQGEYPNNWEHLSTLVADVSYNNAMTFFGY